MIRKTVPRDSRKPTTTPLRARPDSSTATSHVLELPTDPGREREPRLRTRKCTYRKHLQPRWRIHHARRHTHLQTNERACQGSRTTIQRDPTNADLVARRRDHRTTDAPTIRDAHATMVHTTAHASAWTTANLDRQHIPTRSDHHERASQHHTSEWESHAQTQGWTP